MEPTDQQLLDCEFYGPNDESIKMYSKSLVTTRKTQICNSITGSSHTCPPKTVMIREKAFVDGKWASCYMCRSCAIREYKREYKELCHGTE